MVRQISESKKRDGKGMFTSLVAGKGKGQNRDGKRKFKGQNCDGKGKFTSLLGEPTPRAARSPPSAPPVNTFRSSLDVDVERFTNGQSLGVLLARDSRSHSRKFEAQLPRCCRLFCFPLGRPVTESARSSWPASRLRRRSWS